MACLVVWSTGPESNGLKQGCNLSSETIEPVQVVETLGIEPRSVKSLNNPRSRAYPGLESRERRPAIAPEVLKISPQLRALSFPLAGVRATPAALLWSGFAERILEHPTSQA